MTPTEPPPEPAGRDSGDGADDPATSTDSTQHIQLPDAGTPHPAGPAATPGYPQAGPGYPQAGPPPGYRSDRPLPNTPAGPPPGYPPAGPPPGYPPAGPPPGNPPAGYRSPTPGYGPPPNQGYGPPGSAPGYGPPPNQGYGPPGSAPGYGPPGPPNQNYGQAPPGQNYGQAPPGQSYGRPGPPGYGPPARADQGYGQPGQAPAGYGPPASSQQGSGPPPAGQPGGQPWQAAGVGQPWQAAPGGQPWQAASGGPPSPGAPGQQPAPALPSWQQPAYPAAPPTAGSASEPLSPTLALSGGQAPEAGAAAASRRALIVGTGVAVVAGAAGFTWYATAGPTPRATPPAAGYTPPTGAAGTPTALSTVAAIPEGGGVILQDQSVVLTRETGDKVHAFSAVCTHQGCLVSQVSNGKITCPCHGSTFDANTGAVVGGPAPSPLPAVPVTVVNGSVYTG